VLLLARAAVLLALFALSGCAELQRPGPQAGVEFELAGRIAVRFREEAASGNVAWRHARESDELLITSPVGSSVARLVREGSEFVLTTSDQREFRAADAEALTEQVLGFRLPLAGLADWVRAEITRDAQGRPAVIEQGGWRVDYQEFRPDGLPVRLKLAYPGIDLRLAIHEWRHSP
jgi:outer membrane lipoprotein LolB